MQNLTKRKQPIISYGVIAFRFKDDNHSNEPEYLMICRKHTLGYIDFVRGKYSINNKFYILQMFHQMTFAEKNMILNCEFNEIWKELWGNTAKKNDYVINEMNASCEKFYLLKNGILDDVEGTNYSLKSFVDESQGWNEPEWGFPKGRKDLFENDFQCAVREFCEETKMDKKHLIAIYNLEPFKEEFVGSNYKIYNHYYYLMKMDYDKSKITDDFANYEVSQLKWLSFAECVAKIRNYNVEKIKLLTDINETIAKYNIV
jgi:hypothetical protein